MKGIKTMRKRIVALSLLSGLVAFTLVVAPPVSAVEEEEPAPTTTMTQAEKSADKKAATEEKKSERLEATKLRVCEKREAKINALMDRRVTQAEKHLDVFTKIYDRTKAFYEEKAKVAANYEELVQKVDQAKATATTSIATLKEAPDFSCDTDAPKEAATAFKEDYQDVRKDLKAYRTAIKDLIVAVKQAQGELES